MSRGIKRLFWDVETSQNIFTGFSAGYNKTINAADIIHERAIICLCYKWEGAKQVHSLEWEPSKNGWGGNDKPIVEAFAPIAEEADELVAHNGDKFDMKWFNTRHLFHGLDPVPIAKTVDTLVIARRRFYFNSNRLDYIAKYLGLGGKNHTDISLWTDILFAHCPKAMNTMVRYCKKDVVLLEKLYHLLSPYHAPKTHVGVINGNERWSCPHCGSENVKKKKTNTTAKGIEQHQMQCKDCGRYYSIATSVYNQYKKEKGL